jgi:hypothetical protein
MTISKYVRFSGGPAMPTAPVVDPSPGGEIVSHLVKALPSHGVLVGRHEDVEYAHELVCRVQSRMYIVSVSYDWVAKGWWEIFWYPNLGWLRRLLGASEEDELRLLATAVSSALDRLPGIQEKRWYPVYGVNVGPDAPYAFVPEVT